MSEWLRAMSYNVRYDTAEDGKHAWEHRRDRVASTIRFHAPDVIGLQEPLDHQLADIAERVPELEWVGVGRSDGANGGEFSPIGYRTDRLACEATETFWLSETPEQPGSVGWDASYPRIVTWARLRDRRTDTRFIQANTHFSHDSPKARRESAWLLLDRLPQIADGNPIVLTGDFNVVAGDSAHEILAEGTESISPLSNAMDRSSEPHHGPKTSRTDFETLLPDRKIDHVFVSDGIAVGQHGVCTDFDDGGAFPSDHLPVLVDVDPSGSHREM
ncbi:endonuclease/exonuclease/phosphatase family protein [Halorhabdus salina]|uniref:endonuclease/exonuclease/phosphatase family protein n=1 Tax=Halorhabdus salina TaxID=2750670 RepID=UPI00215D809D|nr:endonuclease/exonuclease/phosphatase family protein [Halorhabdus salina]